MYTEDEFLMLSGIQHFVYCRRQWALIHVEQQWGENERTVDGKLFHKNAHNSDSVEKRGNKIIYRGLRIHSESLGLSGSTDVVEFNSSPNGVALSRYDGLWKPRPIEYKKGMPKEHRADEVQLCAEAICLEEMLACEIQEGDLFYGETHRRVTIQFDDELRELVKKYAAEMHDYWNRGYTPIVKMTKGCNACSLKDICLPKLQKAGKVAKYISERMEAE